MHTLFISNAVNRLRLIYLVLSFLHVDQNLAPDINYRVESSLFESDIWMKWGKGGSGGSGGE